MLMENKVSSDMVFKSTSRKAAQILSKILLAIFLFLCLLIALNIKQTLDARKTLNNLKMARNAQEIKTDDWSKGMLKLNEDYKGWLTIFGTEVDHPVVQGKNNNEYLRLDFDKKWDIAGTPFMDQECVSPNGGNIVIYGHMMKDGTMFGSLRKYKDIDFFKENMAALWEDESGDHFYKLFAAMIVPGSAQAKGYINLQDFCGHLSEEDTREMLEQVEERSYIYQTPEIIQGSDSHLRDNYLFVVTCDYSLRNGRLVLVFREMKT